MAATTKVFIDGVSPPSLQAADCNGYTNENNILISSTGQPLQVGDNKQTTEAVSNYASGGGYFYQDSGAANAYLLSPVGAKLAPKDYFEGMHITFLPAASNTGASTVKIGLLSAVPLKTAIGGDLLADDLTTGLYTSAFYTGGEFRIIRSADPTSDLVEQLQTSFAIYGDDIGLVNALVVDAIPEYTAYVAGTYIRVKASLTTTSTTPTLNLNSLGAKNIKYTDGGPLVIGDIKAGGLYLFLYDGTDFQLLNPSRLGVTADQLQKSYALYGDDVGTVNLIATTIAPAYAAYTPGTRVFVKIANTNTATSVTLRINALPAVLVVTEGGASPQVGDIVAGSIYQFMYNGSQWQILNSSGNSPYRFSQFTQNVLSNVPGNTPVLGSIVGSTVLPANSTVQGRAIRFILNMTQLTSAPRVLGLYTNSSSFNLADFPFKEGGTHHVRITIDMVFRTIGSPSTVYFNAEIAQYNFSAPFTSFTEVFSIENTTTFDAAIDNELLFFIDGVPAGQTLISETANAVQLY